MYRWDAEDYHENSSEQHRWGLELLDKTRLSGNEQVIDIGCGDGKITAQISARLPSGSVLGIDKSEEMIRFARGHFSRENFPNLDFMVKDLRELDFNEEFDLAFSNAVLHWVPDHGRHLHTIAAGLREGGKIVAQMGGKGNAEGILRILDSVISSDKWSPYFRGFTAPYTFYDSTEYEGLLQRSGLTVERLQRVPKKMVHQGETGLAAWIRTTWRPYTWRVPEKLRSDFILEIVNNYIDSRGFCRSSPVSVEMVRIEFEAVKRRSTV